MNENIRVIRDPSRGPAEGHPPTPPHRGNGKMLGVVVAGLVVIILAGLVLFRDRMGEKSERGTAMGDYQAVFLSNGQVYFGKLAKATREYLKLTDIFYLQVTPLQGSQTEPRQQPQLQLVKLGNELHGPVDEMHINKEHILFFEDLKDDGKVSMAIKEYKANPNRTSGTSNTQQQGTTQQQQTQPVAPPAPVQQQQRQLVAPPPVNNNNTQGGTNFGN